LPDCSLHKRGALIPILHKTYKNANCILQKEQEHPCSHIILFPLPTDHAILVAMQV
jgi:hypothetical protein